MISCEHAKAQLSRQLDEPLVCRQRLAVRMHLLVCANCREFKSCVMILRQTLRAEHSGDQVLILPEAVKARIRAAILDGGRTH
jgi:predicted anti-sigma-YlaC factor YlaD